MATSMLGFDIGSAQLKIAHWDGSAVKRMVAADMPDNLVKGETIISYDAMADFIKKTLKDAHITERRAAVILPSQEAFLRRVTVPSMTPEQLMINLPYEFRDFLSETKDKYYYDYLVCGTVKGEDGETDQMDILASSVSKQTIVRYREMFRRAGLHLVIALPREVAYINCIKSNTQGENKEYAIVDLGHLSTRLDIFTGTKYETSRIIDMGLKDMDLAIAEAQGVDEHVARTYKVSNHKNCQESDAARRVYEVIAGDLRKAINFYGFSNRESLLKDIYICGGGANVDVLVKTIQETLADMELHEITDILPELNDAETVPNAFVAAIGATLQSTKAGDKTINLIIKEKSKLPLAGTIAGILLIVVAAAAFSKFLVIGRFQEASRKAAEASTLKAEHAELEEYLSDYDEIAAKYAKYSVSWMGDAEKARVNRIKILDVVDTELKNKCTVIDVTISENTALVNITDCSLNQVSSCVEKMLARDDIRDVMMKSAVTDDTTGNLKSAVIQFSMKNAGEN